MAEIKKIYRQSLPAMRFVGKCYRESDKVNGVFAAKWDEWFKNGLFNRLMLDGDEPFEDCRAYYGLCRCAENQPFQYWIGVFLPPDAAVPEGYESLDLAKGEIAVCWIYGKEPDIYTFCSLSALKDAGLEWASENGVRWCFERYVSTRFTQPDENGNVILDMCFYINAQ